MAGSYRMVHREDVTAELVRYLLDYDPITGIFRWKNPTRPRTRKGDKAGFISQRRYCIRIYGFKFPAGQVAWLHFYGDWPKLEIDHRNRNPLDNSIANLRDVTTATNRHNRVKDKRNTSGFLGVSKKYQRKNWQAEIKIGNARYCLGLYPTPQLAAGAYRIAAAALHDIPSSNEGGLCGP